MIRLYLIGIGDEGKGGEPVGCGDSIIPVSRTVIATSTLLRLAYNEVLKLRTRTVEGLYNPLYQSDLTLDRLSINAEGNARVDLSGTLQTGGVCDDPRVIALLEKTAFQFFPTVRTVEVFVNGRALRDILSEK